MACTKSWTRTDEKNYVEGLGTFSIDKKTPAQIIGLLEKYAKRQIGTEFVLMARKRIVELKKIQDLENK